MIEVREFNENHFLDILPNMWAAEQEDIFGTDAAHLEAMVMSLKAHPSYTIFHEAKPVACFGVVVNEDEGEAWTWFTPGVRPIKADFEQILATHLSEIVKDNGLKKVTCGVIKGYEHKMPWVERLGFQKVGERDDREVRYERWHSFQQ